MRGQVIGYRLCVRGVALVARFAVLNRAKHNRVAWYGVAYQTKARTIIKGTAC